jgi:hypothetical protein
VARPFLFNRVARLSLALAVLLALLIVDAADGPVTPLAAVRAQESAERRVFSFFYYWYEPLTADLWNAINHANLSNHFPESRPPDWRSVDWFKGQFADMAQAGIDVALAVYWGDNLYPETTWSTSGLPRMVQALDEMKIARLPAPKVGLFLDTYVLEGANLTDPDRLDWLTAQLRTYFKLVPARHRATQDGRPIIWLYLSNFANDFNQDTFSQLSDRLRDDLGGARPFWVAEVSWRNPTWTDGQGLRHFDPDRLIGFDAFYRWGAAANGTLFTQRSLPIASVGPGYDDRAIADRGDERSARPREDGCFYARNWRKAQQLGSQWVTVETWDELYEGSGIAETAEWGRDYIVATSTYSNAFRQGQPIALPSRCPEVPDDQTEPDDPFFGPATGAPPGPDLADPQPAATPATRRPSPVPTEASPTPSPTVTVTPAPTATPPTEDSPGDSG